MSSFTRREFLRLSTLCASSMVVSTALTGCSSLVTTLSTKKEFSFLHGVASGDPLQHSVILWTRATPKISQASINLSWQIATDLDFKNIVRSGAELVTSETDFTLKIDVQELLSQTNYFYRFLGNDLMSPIGTTKTLPENNIEQLNFVVCSCANYPAGYFNAYDHAAKVENIDAVLHLGDYIYEYEMGGYATEKAVEIGRELSKDNAKELISLTDYRKRYALYRSDASLQKLHLKAPFILIWDDHEIANDTWKDGAKNHNDGEGDFDKRKMAAIQAWYEWLPVRISQPNNKQKIYRSFDFGNLLSLHMLDTRVLARDKQLSYDDYKSESEKFDKKSFVKDLTSKHRKLLGTEQFDWLEKQLATSSAKWQLLGQQILMGRMSFPSELSKYSKKYDEIPNLLIEIADLHKKNIAAPKSMTAKEKKRIKKKNPYNLDAWDGYYHERERLLEIIGELNKNLIVVAGDTHNAWANELTLASGKAIGMEFATQSISSPGMEHYLKMDKELAEKTADALTLVVDDLKYCNLYQRGYLHLNITSEEVNAKWVFVDNILSETYQQASEHTIKYTKNN